MPYFFILPAFVLYVVAMTAAIVVTWVHRPIAYLRRYFLSILLWSSIGFVVSTLVYVILFVTSVSAINNLVHGGSSVAGGIAMGAVVFVVPFVAAATGVIGGAAYGLWKTRGKNRVAA